MIKKALLLALTICTALTSCQTGKTQSETCSKIEPPT